MRRSLYIVDGHGQIYRAYYAPFGNLTSPSGEPTRATHVFCQMLLNLLRDRRPDYLVMVLDADERKLHRRTLFADYKAHREPPPEDLPVQEQRIVDILAAVGVPMLRQEGFEADDIIATLVERLRGPELDVVVVSRDKDLDQLLGPDVTLFDPLKSEVVTAESLKAAKGWGPETAVEAQILTGDTVDNVPGVRGIGPKTAAKLLEKYGSAANVVAHADELSPKQREAVLAFAPQVELVRQLVTLRRDVPLDFALDTAAVGRFDWSAARPAFAELGFRKLVDQLPVAPTAQLPGSSDAAAAAGAMPALKAGMPAADAPAASTGETASAMPPSSPAGGGWATAAAARLSQPNGGDYRLLNTPEALAELVEQLAKQPEFALDTETTDINPVDAELVGISVSWEVGRGYFIVVRSVYDPVLPLELVREKLGPLLVDPTKRKIGQNIKYDLIVLRNAGLPVAGPLFDTMVAAFTLDPLRGSFGLDNLARDLLAHTMIPITDLIGKGRDQLSMDQVPLAHIAEYAAEDADYTWRLKELFEPQLAPAGVAMLFADTEMPLLRVLTDMEYDGVSIDVAYLAEMGRRLIARLDALTTEIHTLAGSRFNLDSPQQLGEVLFDQLGLRVVRRTKTQRSTDADTLETLAIEYPEQPLPRLLLEYRELEKLRGTYVDALPKARSRRTGRIHTNYRQTGAVTGRLSSSEPNLQNIPVRTELGREIRRAFVPRSPAERLIVADYSQVELRVLAHFSQDEALCRAFAEDRDIHAVVAAEVNGVALEEVTKEMRARAKAVNFGIIYGQTAFGLAQNTGMTRTEAQDFINRYFARYPRIRAFIDQCIADAKRTGEVRTILGRRRPILNITSGNSAVRAQAERFAVNTVVQGSAADLIKTAMVQLHRRIATEALPLRIVLQVHDELVCEAPAEDAERLAPIVATTMSQALLLSVPLKVDVAVATNWLDAK